MAANNNFRLGSLAQKWLIKSLLFAFLCVPILSHAATYHKKPCTKDEAFQAENEADTYKDWNGLYKSYKRYWHCDDGAISEGYSDTVGRILTEDWKQIKQLHSLCNTDKAFEKFVINHIDMTIPVDVLQKIIDNARSQCPKHSKKLCNAIERKASEGWEPEITDGQPIIAILEQPQCKEPPTTSARVLFSKSGETWIAIDNPSRAKRIDMSHIKWTIAYSGHNLGTLKTTDPGFHTEYEWTYPRDRILNISPGERIPKKENTTNRFEGWCDSPKYRPLVLVNRPNYKDPSNWKLFVPDNAAKKLLFPEFKAIAGKAEKCLDTDKTETYDYTAEDLVIYEAYRDSLHQQLISIGLDRTHYNCDGPIEMPWTDQWFLINKQGITYIGNTLSLIDAGDYDNDGKSETIFWHSGYNEDGYTLLYDNFKKRTDFYWTYH